MSKKFYEIDRKIMLIGVYFIIFDWYLHFKFVYTMHYLQMKISVKIRIRNIKFKCCQHSLISAKDIEETNYN
jgi:hypothetical protein